MREILEIERKLEQLEDGPRNDWDDYHLQNYNIGFGIPDDMSSGLREIFHEDLNEKMDGWPEGITWGEYYRQIMYYVNFANAVVQKVRKDKPFKYEGYVLKEEYASFEVGELDDFSEWLTEDEYRSLSVKEKRQYIYHRWNDPNGEYWIYRTIADRIWALCGMFEDACAYIGGSIYNGITDSQIRLYVLRE